MTRDEYLRDVMDAYLDSPDTPIRPAIRDWTLADELYRKRIAPSTVAHAVRLATLRRHRRDPNLEPLEPIRSLAYFKAEIEYLHQHPQDPGYVEYVKWSYAERLDSPLPMREEENRR